MSVLQGEEADAVALMASLSADERKAAILGSELPREMFTGAFRDNKVLDYEGIAFDRLSGAAKERLLALISRYVGRIRPQHAEAKMREVLDHLDETYFAWIGGTGADDVFYYRVHSPVILIEFDHQSGVVFDNDYPTRRHIHTVVRTPNGNDYGKDLLRQHYAALSASELRRCERQVTGSHSQPPVVFPLPDLDVPVWSPVQCRLGRICTSLYIMGGTDAGARGK